MYKYKVEFKGRYYYFRLIDFGPGWGNYYVASVQLERLLWNDEHGYTCDEARWVDEMVFYYVGTNYLRLCDDELRRTILEELQ